MQNPPFKCCPNCSKVWNTMEDFLSDPSLEFAGYQVNFVDLEGGLFYFSHVTENCGTTLAVYVKEFTSLSPRSFLNKHGKQPAGCPSLCVRKGSMEPCPVECECLWVREVMKIICDWKKRSA